MDGTPIQPSQEDAPHKLTLTRSRSREKLLLKIDYIYIFAKLTTDILFYDCFSAQNNSDSISELSRPHLDNNEERERTMFQHKGC